MWLRLSNVRFCGSPDVGGMTVPVGQKGESPTLLIDE